MQNVEISFLKRVVSLFAILLATSSRADPSTVTPCDVSVLHPTQEAIGMLAVDAKIAAMKRLSPTKREASFRKDPMPVVLGPGKIFYLIDHHHEARAALAVGHPSVFCVTEADLSKLSTESFWSEMKKNRWVREIDHAGMPLSIPAGLPRQITATKDDPYRSLAYFVRKEGGFCKSAVLYAEFLWGDFFRSRISLGSHPAEFTLAVKKAALLAHTPAARSLPGWSEATCTSSLDDF